MADSAEIGVVVGHVIASKVGRAKFTANRRYIRPYLAGVSRSQIGLAGARRRAGIATKIGNHTFRATGITAYLKTVARSRTRPAMANHASMRTTQLYVSDTTPTQESLEVLYGRDIAGELIAACAATRIKAAGLPHAKLCWTSMSHSHAISAPRSRRSPMGPCGRCFWMSLSRPSLPLATNTSHLKPGRGACCCRV